MAHQKSEPGSPAHEAIRVAAPFQSKLRLAQRSNIKELELYDQQVHTTAKHDRSVALLQYYGGPLLANVEVFVVYWGQSFVDGTLSQYPDRINAFYDSILSSPLMDQMEEYSTKDYKIGHGKRVGSTTITSPPSPKHISDSALRKQLKSWIASNKAFPKAGVNTLYMIYLQNGTTVSMGGAKSCSSFCGYHDAIDNRIFYAVMPFPGCNGCLGDLHPFEALCATSSHELCEAVTDPIPGTGWYNMEYGEVGDICGWSFKSLRNYIIQKEWSNKSGTCI